MTRQLASCQFALAARVPTDQKTQTILWLQVEWGVPSGSGMLQAKVYL